MKNKIQSQLVSLREEYSKLETLSNNLSIACDYKVKEVVEPLFKMHGVLEYNAYLEVRDNYFYIKRAKPSYCDEELISLRINDKLLYKSFYSTNDSSNSEFERMIIIGRIGELVLESGDDLIARYNKVFNDSKEEQNEVYSNMRKLNFDIKELNNQLSQIEEVECIEILKEGVEFETDNNGYLPYLVFKSNESDKVSYVKVLDIKGKYTFIEYISGYSKYVSFAKVKNDNILDFARLYKTEIVESVGVKA